jgi:hypothetical protein
VRDRCERGGTHARLPEGERNGFLLVGLAGLRGGGEVSIPHFCRHCLSRLEDTERGICSRAKCRESERAKLVARTLEEMGPNSFTLAGPDRSKRGFFFERQPAKCGFAGAWCKSCVLEPGLR